MIFYETQDSTHAETFIPDAAVYTSVFQPKNAPYYKDIAAEQTQDFWRCLPRYKKRKYGYRRNHHR